MSEQNNNLTFCRCCTTDAATSLYNSPGLTALRYRIGTHGSFKKEMLDLISNDDVLAKLTTRYDDDFAIATLDAWATVLDILTFYQERICNEGYLRTAIERLSLVYLAQHIHYVPAPGLSAETYLAFSMTEAQGAPSSAFIPVGTKVQSIPKQNQLPQIFETGEEINAKVSWNSIRAKAMKIKYPRANHNEIYLEGIQTGLQPGDKILIVATARGYGSTDNNWDFRTITEVITNSNLGYSLIELDKNIGSSHESTISQVPVSTGSVTYMKAPDYPGLNVWNRSYNLYLENPNIISVNTRFAEIKKIGNLPAVAAISTETIEEASTLQSVDNSTFKVFALRQKSNLFGYNAPNFLVMSAMSDGKINFLGNDKNNPPHPTEWDGFTISAVAANKSNTIYLDTLYPKIIQDSWLIMTTTGNTGLFGISNAAESMRAGFTLASRSMQLTLHQDPTTNFNSNIRDTLVYAQSEELQIAEIPKIEPLNEHKIILDDIVPDLSKGQKLFIAGKRWRLEIPAGLDVKNPEVTIATLDDNTLPIALGISLPIIKQPVKGSDGTIEYIVADDAGSQWSIKDKYDVASGNDWQPKNLNIISAEKDDGIVSEFHIIDSIDFLSDGDSTQNHTRLTLIEPISNYFDLQTVTINANVASANHGETKQEILGNGNSSQIFQKFQLRQQPLTFTTADNPSGAQTTLEIQVNNIKWNEVSSFYGRSPKDKIYTVTIADDSTVTVCFGDGITGSRLPTGMGNIKAIYRTGIGSSGLMDAGQLSMLATPQLGVNKVINPLVSSGAQDPETLVSARKNAPLTVLTLDRIVSAKDFENFTRSFAGIGKARADVTWNGEQEIVNITAALANGKPIQSIDKVYDKLLNAFKEYGHTKATINITGYNQITFTIDVGIAIANNYLFDDVKLNVANTLFNMFSFDAMNFGVGITAAVVINVLQQVEGVVYVRLNNDLSAWNSIQPAELLTIDINNSSISQLP